MSGVSVSDEDGRLVAVKQAADHPDAEARIRMEADALIRLDHPGVVQLVQLDEGPPVRLVTSFVGPDSWARRPPTDAQHVAEGLAKVASIVADLHDSNITHGALISEHVLIGPGGRPVLCGLADSRPSTEETVQADNQALASLIRELATELPANTGDQLNAVANHLDQGGAVRLATRELDQIARPESSSLVPTSTRRPLTIGVAALLVVAVVSFVFIGLGGSKRQGAVAAPNVGAGTSSSTGVVSTPQEVAADRSATSTIAATTDTVPTQASPESPVLVHGGRRFGVGLPGDIAVRVDWDCDGTATPALLRLATGEIAVFAHWPAPRQTIEPVFVTTIEGAVGIDVDTADGCELLRARTTAGSQIVHPEIP